MDSFDLEIAVRTAWMEARGEGTAGERAVLWVLRHRLEKPKRFGPTMAAVCLLPYQFSCWNTADPNRIRAAELPFADSELVALRSMLVEVMSAPWKDDPTLGATHYFAHGSVAPQWASGREPCVIIGRHLFYNNVP